MSAARRRRWPRRLLGLLVALLLVELALQAAAPLVQAAMLRRPPTPSPDAPLTILCVGDSNTYGLHVPQWSYPAQLEARLRPRFSGPVAVVNRGVPGQSTEQVADALPGDLRAARPDIVLVLAGLNDAWNAAAADDDPERLLGRLRLVRLVRVLLSGVASPGDRFEVRTDERGEVVVDRGEGGRRVNVTEGGSAASPGEVELQARVRAGLVRVVETCRDFGAQPVLMSYAENGGTHSVVSAAARALASEQGLLFVDHERAFAAAFATEGHDALMFNEHHPNARGYALMARCVDEALQGAGHVPPAAGEPAAPAGPRPRPPVAPVLAHLGAGRLRLSGPPGWSWQLAVARAPAPGDSFSAGSFTVPLPNDDVLAKARLEPSFLGRFGPGGTAEVLVPLRLREEAGGAPLAACLVLLHDASAGPGEAVAAVSTAVSLD
jgi:lysophospholipase L1-like esterase